MNAQVETRKRRHCMVVFALYPFSETRVQREAEALVRHGYEVDVICPKQPGEADVGAHRGVNIYRVPKIWKRKRGLAGQLFDYLSFFCLASLKLASLHRRRAYSVVQTHNVPDFLVFSALIPRLLGARVILDLHDLMPEFYQGRTGQASDSLPVRLIFLQERLSCRFADHVITVTEHWRQALIRRGLPPEKCSVVMNLADHRVFQPAPLQLAPKKDASGFHLFYHGYMPERYGLDLVLLAMDRIRSEVPKIHLTLVGGGEHLETLKSMAADLGLQEGHVKFMRSVPVEELPSLISAADAGVVPYRNDPFADSLLPTKLMEYAAMGFPAIVARTTAISIYFDDSMVRFFKPGDVEDLARCILELHHDRQRLAEYAQGICGFNERYNWPEESEKYVQTVDRLAASKGHKNG